MCPDDGNQASASSNGPSSPSKKTSAKKSSTKAAAKKTSKKPAKGKIVMGTGAFKQPEAIAGVGAPQATIEERCRGEHPSTNAPVFTGMGKLHHTQSPSRVGFEHLTATAGCAVDGDAAPSSLMPTKLPKAKARLRRAA